MSFQLVILDFDGTFTDVEREAGPFFDAYRSAASAILSEDLGVPDFEARWERAIAKVQQDPAHYGWTYDGRVVAPGSADPYLRATVIFSMMLEEAGVLTDPQARGDLLQRLYEENYPKAGTAFRPEAKEVVEALIASGLPIFVVTNSATADVERKLDHLAPVGREKLEVHGSARKFFVTEEGADAAFNALPAEQHVEGLRRPILVRRGHYYRKLQELWTRTGATPETTLIVGDIYELDLALPAHLGAHVHLVLKEMTPQFERDALAPFGDRAQLSDSLRPALARALG